MRLTLYSDYAMRVLLYLATRPDQLSSITEVSQSYGISQSHVMKVVSDLVNAGYITSIRGRSGGIKLARTADDINIGAVIRHTEDSFALVDCGSCRIAPACDLKGVFGKAVAAFLAVLDEYSLEEIISERTALFSILHKSDNENLPLCKKY